MPKSVTKRLVNSGWSMKPLKIFLNITIPLITQMFKKWLPDLFICLNVQGMLVKISAMILLYSKGYCKKKKIDCGIECIK
ncbi:hypothetical protein [Methylobacter sp. S3L5C]|uniref:hypothetical protein n=1 Tax=Methylobacter sp. S3L5C TaxID=2839024 RepID=UPI001FAC260F|nr:hypothetical protein [Methylobacter sp. S3L5C]UOA09249.1 hypothetical protein KKZ03_02710 [Methylobacter sp. S3L5C]